MAVDIENARRIELTYTPTDKQRQAHQSTATYVLYGGAVRGGKSVWLVNEMLQQCLDWERNIVGIFRWENTTFKATTYPTIQRWILDVPGLVTHHDRQEQRIELMNGSTIRYGGIKPSASVGGADPQAVLKSLELGACGVDELTDVPKDFYDTLCSRIGCLPWKARNTETGEWRVPPPKMCCTCNPEPGWVKYQWVDQKLPEHEFIPSKVSDNPHAPPDYEARLRRRYPKEWVDKYVEGDWTATTLFDAVWPYAWLVDAMKRKGTPDTEDVSFGVDVAEYGGDKTVIVKRSGYVAETLLVRSQQDTMVTVGQVQMLAEEHHPSRINIDAIGVGAGVASRLAELGLPIIPIIGGAQADEPERFLNLRAELHWRFRNHLEAGLVSLPSDAELLNEMGTIKYLIHSDRKIQIESKEIMRKRGVKSPNKSDAIVYAFADVGARNLAAGLI